jgi:hypothetical protein
LVSAAAGALAALVFVLSMALGMKVEQLVNRALTRSNQPGERS